MPGVDITPSAERTTGDDCDASAQMARLFLLVHCSTPYNTNISANVRRTRSRISMRQFITDSDGRPRTHTHAHIRTDAPRTRRVDMTTIAHTTNALMKISRHCAIIFCVVQRRIRAPTAAPAVALTDSRFSHRSLSNCKCPPVIAASQCWAAVSAACADDDGRSAQTGRIGPHCWRPHRRRWWAAASDCRTLSSPANAKKPVVSGIGEIFN